MPTTTTTTNPDEGRARRTFTYNEAGLVSRFESNSGYWCTFTYNEAGQETGYENSQGFRRTRTYNAAGQETHFEGSDGCWRITTYNAAGQETHYENSEGHRRTRTYNAAGQETSYEDSGKRWLMLATDDGEYLLRVSVTTPHVYWVGCHKFTREQAVRHWSSPRKDNIDRAAAFLAAVISHKED